MPSSQGYQKVATAPVAQPSSMDTNISRKIPSTNSSQQLMPPDAESVTTSLDEQESPHRNRRPSISAPGISKREWFTVAVLCFVNLINYMDRFTIAGVLTDIQHDFNIGDDQGGLLQTAFVLSYMVFAPLFGFMGDRYSRKWIMAAGVFLWSATTLLGSFMTEFYWFLSFRALVGIGEASYSTIAPTIISDLFVSDVRSKMLALFYFAIPVGSGLGYIVGSETAKFAGTWRAALRVTPVLGIAAVVLIGLLKDPKRGQSEGSHNLAVTSYKEDIKAIAKNPSFMLSTAGFTCVAFVAGALAWWGPTFIHLGLLSQPGNENVTLNDVSLIFGSLTMMSGIIGVPLGSYLSQRFNRKYPRADPYICAVGLILSAPFLAGAMIVVTANAPAAYVLVFFGELALNLNWAIVADMLLYVVVPTRRSTAEAFQILISHTFGDAGSPYLVGVISEAIKNVMRAGVHGYSHFAGNLESLSLTAENATLTATAPALLSAQDTNEMKFKALQYALFSTSFVEIIGGVFFLLTAIYILKDKGDAEREVAESQVNEPQNQYADNTTISSTETN